MSNIKFVQSFRNFAQLRKIKQASNKNLKSLTQKKKKEKEVVQMSGFRRFGRYFFDFDHKFDI